eukprot:3556411-Ditylum_brightwellii.AAC.1
MDEAFPSLRFVAGDAFKNFEPLLIDQLAAALIENPPHELSWIKKHTLQEYIFEAMTKAEKFSHLLTKLPKEHLNDVLALRGFLAGGILVYCLMKRYRVDFGIAPNGKKCLAVPFRAADMPSERAEFAHSDCALCLTTIAYYSNGLSYSQLQNALKKLLDLGKNAQRKFYDEWYQLSLKRMIRVKSKCISTLDNINKIDPQNKLQQKNMWNYFRRNIKAINFWLNYCIFPGEMEQYSKRLTTTSWHLAHNPSSNTIGFSGTNDNHRILPLQ